MGEINNRVLSSLALIHTNILSNDYISTFIPFVATIIKNKEYETIEISTVCEDFKSEYGFGVPRAPMTTILSRCINEGLISKGDNGTYFPVWDKVQTRAFSAQQKQSEQAYSVVINQFIKFARLEFSREYALSKAENTFLSFLEKYSQNSLGNSLIDDEEIFMDENDEENKDLFVMARFIQYTYQYEQELFNKIQQLSLAHIVAAAIAYDIEPEHKASRFDGITLYLDTPLVLRLLGLQTDEMQVATIEMFKIFDETISPTYKIFGHTYNEISGILQDCARSIEAPPQKLQYTRHALAAFIKKKYSRLDVEMYIEKLAATLKDEYSIEIDDMSYSLAMFHKYQINEVDLRKKMEEVYKEKRPGREINQHTLNFDVHSISNIFKLRGSLSTHSYKTAKYLFLTTNSALAYASRTFMKDADKQLRKTAPCLTDYFLGTMMWLSTSVTKLENYSQAKLLADCCAATEASPELIEKYVEARERLKAEGKIGDNDYLLLRAHTFETRYLENRTLNEEDAFTDEMIDVLLEDIKEQLTAPLKDTIEQQRQEIAQLNYHKQHYEKKVDLENDTKTQLKEKAEIYTRRFADIFVLVPVALLVFAITLFLGLVTITKPWQTILIVVSAFLTLLSTLIDVGLRTNFRGLENRMRNYWFKRLMLKEYSLKLGEDSSSNAA